MQDKMMIGHLYPRTLQPLQRQTASSNSETAPPNGSSKPFADLLRDNMVRMSNHAKQRLEQRGIELSDDQLVKLKSAIDKAEQKGANDSLMLFQNMALIVNVKNKTIVTAVDRDSMTDNIFTKIDSAVIIT